MLSIANITNISITKAANEVLRKQRQRTHLLHDELFGMVYIEFFTEADGSTVKGFSPGYQAGSWKLQYITSDWLRARPGGIDFCFLPKFEWNPREHYLVDNVSGDYALFSIKPAK